jgi:radical SAM protein with 4Fe4S-binding SPASM domain
MNFFKKILYYPFYLNCPRAFQCVPNVAIEISGACNYECVFCGYSGKREKGFMSYELFRDTIDNLKPFKIDNLALAVYGEPLLHPRFTDIIEYALNNGHAINLYTNGSLLNSSLAENIINLGVRNFHITFIPHKEIYEKIFKGGHYDIVVGNILSLLKIINKNKGNFYLEIMLITDEEDTFIAYKNACEGIFGKNRLISYARSFFLPVYGQSAKCKFPHDYKYIHPCESVYRSINILWNQDVVPCCFDLNGLLIMGNIKEDNLANIWNNAKFVELRRRLAKNEQLTEPCLNCFARYYKEHPLVSLLRRKARLISLRLFNIAQPNSRVLY